MRAGPEHPWCRAKGGRDAGKWRGAGRGRGAGRWGGHAWNAVRLDGAWYHIDATFDDPVGNPGTQVSHFYFGQTDEVMSANHRWAREYFPVSGTFDFLYFRQEGLFAEDWESFETTMTALFYDTPIAALEIAVRGATVDENNIQFITNIRPEFEKVRWREKTWNDVHVILFEFIYVEG